MREGEVLIIRICQLWEGDKFLWGGQWRTVTRIDTERLHFDSPYDSGNNGGTDSLGKNSQQFVQAHRSEPTPKKRKTHKRRISKYS